MDDQLLAHARQFVGAAVDYSFTERERAALAPFFSNHDRKVFFLSGLPESVAATLLAMYSRLKNPRGLRGHFVDHLVPLLMCAPGFTPRPADQVMPWREVQAEFKRRGLNSLDKIANSDVEHDILFRKFIRAAADPAYWRLIADSDRIRAFKDEHLDKYGHNSIARPARLLLCAEGVSIQAAKAFEETWPGTAFIELSTRYVDFSKKNQYPVWEEIGALVPALAALVRETIEAHTADYQWQMGAKFDGPFPQALRAWAGPLVTDAKDLEAGIVGETCDVLGNLLPCSTLTELGMGVSGEALGQLLKSLRLQATPECLALAECIVDETRRSGNDYFLRHHEPSIWEEGSFSYLSPTFVRIRDLFDERQAEFRILAAYGKPAVGEYVERAFRQLVRELEHTERGDHDKLPPQFRTSSVMVQDVMSYRGWRDLQRMSLSIHFRSRVTPVLGFYRYPKRRFPELELVFGGASERDRRLYEAMMVAGVPEELAEYPMAMGELVTYQITSDLRQAEFCGWQRSKWGVNDEVRQSFLAIEQFLRGKLWWWARLSRADMTPHYVFARGSTPVVVKK